MAFMGTWSLRSRRHSRPNSPAHSQPPSPSSSMRSPEPNATLTAQKLTTPRILVDTIEVTAARDAHAAYAELALPRSPEKEALIDLVEQARLFRTRVESNQSEREGGEDICERHLEEVERDQLCEGLDESARKFAEDAERILNQSARKIIEEAERFLEESAQEIVTQCERKQRHRKKTARNSTEKVELEFQGLGAQDAATVYGKATAQDDTEQRLSPSAENQQEEPQKLFEQKVQKVSMKQSDAHEAAKQRVEEVQRYFEAASKEWASQAFPVVRTPTASTASDAVSLDASQASSTSTSPVLPPPVSTQSTAAPAVPARINSCKTEKAPTVQAALGTANIATPIGAADCWPRCLDMFDMKLPAKVFDPNCATVHAELLSRIGASPHSVIKAMEGFAGGLNEGIWFLSEPSSAREELTLKLVRGTRKYPEFPTEAENLLRLHESYPNIAKDPSLSFPFQIAHIVNASLDEYDLLIMRKAPGQSLADHVSLKFALKQMGKLQEIMEKIGASLGRFHANYGGQQHGDFQPSNIFYDEQADLVTFIDVGGIGIPTTETDSVHFEKSMLLCYSYIGAELTTTGMERFKQVLRRPHRHQSRRDQANPVILQGLSVA